MTYLTMTSFDKITRYLYSLISRRTSFFIKTEKISNKTLVCNFFYLVTEFQSINLIKLLLVTN